MQRYFNFNFKSCIPLQGTRWVEHFAKNLTVGTGLTIGLATVEKNKKKLLIVLTSQFGTS